MVSQLRSYISNESKYLKTSPSSKYANYALSISKSLQVFGQKIYINSLTKNNDMWGWFPLLTMISTAWENSEVVMKFTQKYESNIPENIPSSK